METALSCVRGLLAQAVADREDQALDNIVQRCGQQGAMRDSVDVGDEQPAFDAHKARRLHAYEQFRSAGRFVLPLGRIVFASMNLPTSAPADAFTAVEGVSGLTLSSEYLAGTPCADNLRRHSSAVAEIEDLTPLINACGLKVLDGNIVEITGMTQADGPNAKPVDYVSFTDRGVAKRLPYSEFVSKTSVYFLPMIVNFQNENPTAEDLQGMQQGISYGLSNADVAGAFTCYAETSHTTDTKIQQSGLTG
jgi:hypothetical protein